MTDRQMTVMVYPASVKVASGGACIVGVERLTYPFGQTNHEHHVFEDDSETCRCGRVTVRRV